MIVLLNGAFGIGKTTVARALAARLPRTILFDPEIIGIALQRIARLAGRKVDDFQDLRLWRQITIAGLWMARRCCPRVVVPMAFSNAAYLQEICDGISRFEPSLFHFCLVAPVDVVHERIRGRRADSADAAWQLRRASECCLAHQRKEFATQIVAAGRDPDDIANELIRAIAPKVD